MAVVDHLDRPVGGAGEQGGVDGEQARIVLLATEAAADRRGPHARLLGSQAERMDQRLVNVIRALHRADRGHAVTSRGTIGLDPGDHPLALEIDVLLMAGAPLTRDHPVGESEPRFQAAAVHRDLIEGRQSRGLLHAEHGGKRLVDDLDGGESLAGGERRSRGHERDRLADVAHDVGGQDRPGVVEELDAVGTGEIGRGDADRAGRSALWMPADGDDPGVRMRAAHRGAVQHPGQGEIVHIPGRPRHLGEAVRSWGALTDSDHPQGEFEATRRALQGYSMRWGAQTDISPMLKNARDPADSNSPKEVSS